MTIQTKGRRRAPKLAQTIPGYRVAVSAWRAVKRMKLPQVVLILTAVVATVVFESAIARVVHRMAGDELTALLFTTIQIVASIGIIFGPMAISLMHHSQDRQRRFAGRVILACFALSIWNASTVMGNAELISRADQARSAATFDRDMARLDRLDSRIEALADEPQSYTELQTLLGERDEVQARVGAAVYEPVMIAPLTYWIKAIVFHGIVGAIINAFGGRQPTKKKKPVRKPVRQDQRPPQGNVAKFPKGAF